MILQNHSKQSRKEWSKGQRGQVRYEKDGEFVPEESDIMRDDGTWLAGDKSMYE